MLSCTCKLMLCMLLSNGKNFSLSIQLFLQLLPNYRSRYVISLAAVYLFYKIPNFVSNLQLRCFPLPLLVTTHDNLLTSVECLSLLCMYMETLSRTLYSLVSTFFKLLSFLLFYFIFSLLFSKFTLTLSLTSSHSWQITSNGSLSTILIGPWKEKFRNFRPFLPV